MGNAPLEKFKPIGTPTMFGRGSSTPGPMTSNQRRELWIGVIPFAVAAIVVLISPNLGIVVVPTAVLLVTLILGFPALGKRKPISVVPTAFRPLFL